MRKLRLLSAFLLISVFSKAQCYPSPCPCVDSSRINIYYHCYANYDPQCGCDGKTYRNVCTAYYWGGLINSPNPFPYGNGPCGNFDFDFVPNVIVQGSSDPNYNDYGTLSLYTKIAPVAVLIQIYDVWGRVWYLDDSQVIPQPQVVYTTQPVRMDGFPQGIYYLFVTINGETKYKKVMKATLQ